MGEEIKICHTPSGDPVISYNGRQMSSFIGPHKEAVEWMDHYAKSLQGRDCAIVLGLGSGYHLAALAERFSGRMIVVEKLSALIDHFEETFPLLYDRIEFILLNDMTKENLLKCELRSYTVLAFAPAIFSFKTEYQDIFNLLVGRSGKSLGYQFKLRGVDHYFCPSHLDLNSPSASYRHLAVDQAIPLRWKNLFRMMGEIIK